MLVSTTIFNFMAFRYLQLDEALAILFSTPFLVAILAGPMLGEWVGWRRWTAIIGRLCRRAGGDAPRPRRHAMGRAVLGRRAVCYAVYGITTRMLSRTDSSETTLFYANLWRWW